MSLPNLHLSRLNGSAENLLDYKGASGRERHKPEW
jgi:hypothetical protein